MHLTSRTVAAASAAIVLSLLCARSTAAQSAPAKPAPAAATSAGNGAARIVKPTAHTVTGGYCRNNGSGTLGGVFPNDQHPILAFTVGPGSAMADALHANKAPVTGPGHYKNVIIAVYLGKTALVDAYLGLGTITVNADGKTGSFALNDGTASGTWDCGTSLR